MKRHDKTKLQDQIRELRQQRMTLQAIAAALGLSFGYVRWFTHYYGIPKFLILPLRKQIGRRKNNGGATRPKES